MKVNSPSFARPPTMAGLVFQARRSIEQCKTNRISHAGLGPLSPVQNSATGNPKWRNCLRRAPASELKCNIPTSPGRDGDDLVEAGDAGAGFGCCVVAEGGDFALSC